MNILACVIYGIILIIFIVTLVKKDDDQIEATEEKVYWKEEYHLFDDALNKIKELKTQLAEKDRLLNEERKLNKEIKARFVKCNTCTDDMKEKCLMFSENLCEGERCEELVDIVALINKDNLKIN